MTQIFTHLTRPHNGADFLGGTSCSNTQESIDSDDEDTAVSFNNPTGQKTGTPSPQSRKYSSRMYHGTPRLKNPLLQSFSGPHWSRKIPLALAVKSSQRRMALERVHYLNHISLITHWWCISHFQGFRLRSTPIHFQLNLKMSVCYYLPSFLFTHLSRVAWISWLPAETT